jgi:hypothetical protein
VSERASEGVSCVDWKVNMSQLAVLRFLPATFGLLREHAPAVFYFCFPNWVLEQCPLPSTHLKVGHLCLSISLSLSLCLARPEKNRTVLVSLTLSLCLARPQKNRTVLERNVFSMTFFIPVIICDYSEWDLCSELHI